MNSVTAQNPLAEVFGFPIGNESEDAKNHRTNKFCPYHNITAKCTKVDKIDPLGVCSMYHKGVPVITCPVRFRQNWTIISDAAKFFFGNTSSYLALPEIRLTDKNNRKSGNIDYVLVLHDERGRVLDFASLEVQAVYISGTIRGAFQTYIENPIPNFEWRGLNYPRPDYLSSSNKRLIPQMLVKGGIFKQWNKKQAVAVQTTFFETLPDLVEVSSEESDLAWFLYDLVPTPDKLRYNFTHTRTVYTQFESTLLKFTAPEAGDITQFVQSLQKEVDTKLTNHLNLSQAIKNLMREEDDL